MQLEDYFDFLTADDIRIKGHRIGIEAVLYEYVHNEQSPEALVERFPTLSLEQIYATILFYLHNKERIERYLANWLERGDHMRAQQASAPTATMIKLREIRAEYETKRTDTFTPLQFH